MDRNYDIINFISKYYLKDTWVANFVDIIKILIMLIKTTY